MDAGRPSVTPPASASPDWPSVAVVIPTRGRPELLERAIRSVLGQDYPGEIDCVVVFDQTLPALPDVPTGLRRRLRAVENDRAAGAAGARNAGALRAETDYLAFLDDDDRWAPDKLRVQMEMLRDDDRAVAAVCGMRIHYRGRVRERLSEGSVITKRDLLRGRRMETSFCTLLVRRGDFIDRVGLIDEEIPGAYGEDYDWMLRATRLGPLLSVRRPLVDVYWHEGSWFVQQWRTIAAALEQLLARHPEFKEEPAGLARILGQMAFAYAAAGDSRRARAFARRTFKLNPLEGRAYLALAASLRLLPVGGILRVANFFGKGI